MKNIDMEKMLITFKQNGITEDILLSEISRRFSGVGEKNQFFDKYSREDLLAIQYKMFFVVN